MEVLADERLSGEVVLLGGIRNANCSVAHKGRIVSSTILYNILRSMQSEQLVRGVQLEMRLEN